MFSRNQDFCLKNWKLWRTPTTTEFNIFCWNFAYAFYLPMSTKECSAFLLFCLDLELFAKIKKTWFLHTFFYIFNNNPRSKQNIKNPEHPFVHIIKWETCAKFQQKILKFTVVGAHQSFRFFRQITWILRNNKALSKFRYRILYNLISIIKS